MSSNIAIELFFLIERIEIERPICLKSSSSLHGNKVQVPYAEINLLIQNFSHSIVYCSVVYMCVLCLMLLL